MRDIESKLATDHTGNIEQVFDDLLLHLHVSFDRVDRLLTTLLIEMYL